MTQNRTARFPDWMDRFLACLDIRLAFDKACIARDFEALWMAFDEAFWMVTAFPNIDLPFIASVPAMTPIIAGGRQYVRKIASKEEEAHRHAEFLASMPSAKQLQETVRSAGESYEFHGYTLWRESGGWALTNAYGIDYSAFLSTERHFEWLLNCVKKGVDIGPVPPCSQDPEVEPDPYGDWVDICHGAAEALIDQLEAGDFHLCNPKTTSI